MKTLNLCLLFFMSCSAVYNQDFNNRCGAIFNLEQYPADSFSAKKERYSLGRTEIVFTKLHHDYFEEDDGFFQIWVEQTENGKVLKSEYWGFEEGENGYQLPLLQPIKDYFIINKSGEFSGNFYLISDNGIWHKIPGNEIYLSRDKTTLYTFVPVECGGCQIGRFDLKSNQLITKLWDGQGVAWEEIKTHSELVNVFEDGEWIKW